jgi:hypothetical protein
MAKESAPDGWVFNDNDTLVECPHNTRMMRKLNACYRTEIELENPEHLELEIEVIECDEKMLDTIERLGFNHSASKELWYMMQMAHARNMAHHYGEFMYDMERVDKCCSQ